MASWLGRVIIGVLITLVPPIRSALRVRGAATVCSVRFPVARRGGFTRMARVWGSCSKTRWRLRLARNVCGEQRRSRRSETAADDGHGAIAICSGSCRGSVVLYRSTTCLRIVVVACEVIAMIDFLSRRWVVALAMSQRRFTLRSVVMVTMA